MSVDTGNGSVNDEFTVVLEGGRPWGFTLSGGADFRSPLKIGKVRSTCLFWQSALCITVDNNNTMLWEGIWCLLYEIELLA